jgi:hypothetical protein
MEDVTLDLSGVQPAAREIVRAAAEVYAHHTAPWLVGLLVHGSALKGGFIPGCSDVDLKLYLRDEAFAGPGTRLPFALAANIQRDLARIDPAPFQYIQCYAERSVAKEGQVGPIPGAYHLVLGRLPVAEASDAQLCAAAQAALDRLDPYPDYIASGLLEHGGGRLERTVRFICTDVWPILYQVLCLQQSDAVHVWGLPKRSAIELLAPDSPLRSPIEGFYESVVAYYDGDPSVERALAVLRDALAFLSAASMWWREARGRH